MKKLSEFVGQEHVTSVLRAMVIKGQVTQHISLLGDTDLAIEIAQAFQRSLNCASPVKGDACGTCEKCAKILDAKTLSWVTAFNVDYKYLFFTDTYEPNPPLNAIYVAFEEIEGFLTFILEKELGYLVHKEILPLFIRSLQGERAEVLKLSKELAKKITYYDFVTKYLELLKDLMYLQNNLAIAEVANVEVLRKLAVRLQPGLLASCMRLLWETKHGVLPDGLAIQTLSVLLSETLAPSESYDIMAGYSETPITTVEVTSTVEQPLTLEKMFEIVNS